MEKTKSFFDAQVEWAETLVRKTLECRKKIEAVDAISQKYSSFSPSLSFSYGNLFLTLTVPNMRDMVPVLKDLREAGYKCTHYIDLPKLKRRTYYLSEDIYVYGELKRDESAQCEYVLIGYETVEKPIYKLVCKETNHTSTAEAEAEGATIPTSSLSSL